MIDSHKERFQILIPNRKMHTIFNLINRHAAISSSCENTIYTIYDLISMAVKFLQFPQ